MSLFLFGSFALHSGGRTDFKIDCDALTDGDWYALAARIARRVSAFGSVEGVPRGGLKLAEMLKGYCTAGPVLIVDDVLTTGASMEQQRAGRDAMGVVVFARGPVPSWIEPLFLVMEEAPTP